MFTKKVQKKVFIVVGVASIALFAGFVAANSGQWTTNDVSSTEPTAGSTTVSNNVQNDSNIIDTYVSTSEDEEEAKTILYDYQNAIQNKDIDSYINLYADEMKEDMKSYAEEASENDFFLETSFKINDITLLSSDTACTSAGIDDSELSDYDKYLVFYANETITYDQTNEQVSDNSNVAGDFLLDSGDNYHVYVLVYEDGWKILRVSTPDIATIIDSGEGFGTKEEQYAASMQEELVENED